MIDSLKLLETCVDDILKSTPLAARFFLNKHTACVGCGFVRFCKLKNVIEAYQFDEKDFLKDLSALEIQNH